MALPSHRAPGVRERLAVLNLNPAFSNALSVLPFLWLPIPHPMLRFHQPELPKVTCLLSLSMYHTFHLTVSVRQCPSCSSLQRTLVSTSATSSRKPSLTASLLSPPGAITTQAVTWQISLPVS